MRKIYCAALFIKPNSHIFSESYTLQVKIPLLSIYVMNIFEKIKHNRESKHENRTFVNM